MPLDNRPGPVGIAADFQGKVLRGFCVDDPAAMFPHGGLHLEAPLARARDERRLVLWIRLEGCDLRFCLRDF